MNIENPKELLGHYSEHTVNICNFVLDLAEDFNLEDKCVCQLTSAFFDLSTAIWIFENCDEDLLIEHQMNRVDEIENEVLELSSDFDHNRLH
jgi:hypothetical protein